ncbi:hypothetical protein M0804_003969 [Polistes exclamans]|nr:hypothetical protein M0804_003969 [Polistes exclamans]
MTHRGPIIQKTARNAIYLASSERRKDRAWIFKLIGASNGGIGDDIGVGIGVSSIGNNGGYGNSNSSRWQRR